MNAKVEFQMSQVRPLRQAQDRPFKVLGIQQIAIGGPDKTRLKKLWV